MGRKFRRSLAVVLGLTLAINISLPLAANAFGPGDALMGIDTKPDSVSNDSTPTFTFITTAPEEDVRCQIDAGSVVPCGFTYTTPTLPDGMHEFTVSVSGAVNPESTANYSWLIDTTNPDTEIFDGPDSPTTNPVGHFLFSGSEMPVTFECSMDADPYTVCTSPYTSSELSNGSHTFRVRAVDGADNVDPSPDSYTWTVAGEEEPIELNTCTELQLIGHDTDYPLNGSYVLGNDIDCDGQTFSPIGIDEDPFAGIFDGQGYTVRDFVTDSNAPYEAMFGTAEGAQIKSLHLSDVNAHNGAGVVGNSLGVTLSDIYAENITGSAGLIAVAQSNTNSIERSFVSGNMHAFDSGGLIARSDGSETTITDSYVDATIGGKYIGGLVGFGGDLTIDSSYANVTLNGEGEGVGGMVGAGTIPTIVDSFAIADIGNDYYTAGGLAGMNDGASSTDNSYFYATSTAGDIHCDADETPDGCTEVDSPDDFLGDSEPAPTDTWDQTIWNLHEDGQLPTFVVGVAECDHPTQPKTSITFRCEFQREMKHRYTGQQVSGEFRYQEHYEDTWHYGEISEDGDIHVEGLESGTFYHFQVHATFEIGSTDWTSSDNLFTHVTALASELDIDGDGVPDTVERAGPNDGDANGDRYDDGVITTGNDDDQANVTSLVNPVTGNYTALQTDCIHNHNVSIGTEPLDNKDAGYDYSLGLVSFTGTNCGDQVTISLFFYGDYDATDYTARKYNSESGTYTTIPGAVFSNVTIGGEKALKLVYQIDDNGPFDQDPSQGNIADPSGPATAIVGSPNTGLGR